MMPSPPIDHSYDTCHPRWLATGHDQVRIRALDAWYAANPVMQRDDHVLTPVAIILGSARNQPPQPLLFDLFKPRPSAKSP